MAHLNLCDVTTSLPITFKPIFKTKLQLWFQRQVRAHSKSTVLDWMNHRGVAYDTLTSDMSGGDCIQVQENHGLFSHLSVNITLKKDHM